MRMREITNINPEPVDLPKEGDTFFAGKTKFKVWEVQSHFDDYIKKYVAEIIVTSKDLGMKIIINSTYPFSTE